MGEAGQVSVIARGPADFLVNGPEGGRRVVLAHGAGAPMDSGFMEAFAEGLAGGGLRVLRFEFAYMRGRRSEGRKRPQNAQAALLQEWRDVVAELGGGEGLVIGGKSMGGRMASMVADELGCRGLVCLGYPFHAPGPYGKARIAHLETLQTPALILQGTRDSFGGPNEVNGYPLSPAVRVHWLADGDHDFKPRKQSGRAQRENWDEGIAAVVEFVRGLE
ncbi:MAG: alpha/beta family hydrolase [Tepidiformaceae bacterium]